MIFAVNGENSVRPSVLQSDCQPVTEWVGATQPKSGYREEKGKIIGVCKLCSRVACDRRATKWNFVFVYCKEKGYKCHKRVERGTSSAFGSFRGCVTWIGFCCDHEARKYFEQCLQFCVLLFLLGVCMFGPVSKFIEQQLYRIFSTWPLESFPF